MKITRGILEVLRDFGHPVVITTKSALVVRDLDILAPMAARGLARVAVSVTTLDPATARVMEPRAPAPAKRLAAIAQLSAAGVPTAVMTAPIIPALNDWEMERILEAAAAHGASGAGYVLLRLPLEIKDLFTEWLATHFPKRAQHVLALIRDVRGGKLNDPEIRQPLRRRGRLCRAHPQALPAGDEAPRPGARRLAARLHAVQAAAQDGGPAGALLSGAGEAAAPLATSPFETRARRAGAPLLHHARERAFGPRRAPQGEAAPRFGGFPHPEEGRRPVSKDEEINPARKRSCQAMFRPC